MTINKERTQTEIEEMHQKVQELTRALSYYKNLSDEVAGYNILMDSKTILLKRELDQKLKGFSILSSLHKVIGKKVDRDELLNQTLNLIITTLKMDNAVVLWDDADNGVYEAKWWLGYKKEALEKLKTAKVNADLVNQSEHWLCNKSSSPNQSLTELKGYLSTPFIIGIPLTTDRRISGWLFAGRHKEAQPFYPPLAEGDLFTFHAIGVFLEAAMDNIRLYGNLQQVNSKLEAYNIELEKEVAIRTKDIAYSNEQLQEEKKKSDELLLNILPKDIAEELKAHGRSKARLYDNLTVLFTDFVNFTRFAEQSTPEELVAEIDTMFRAFDDIVQKYGIEKIKTIGDAYLCTGGISESGGQVKEVVMAALEMRDYIENYKKKASTKNKAVMDIRLGIHIGPAVAGVVGSKKFAFDIWGDTVNIASRMETNSIAGKINVSGGIFNRCTDDFQFEYRGKVDVKNKGMYDMYFVERK